MADPAPARNVAKPLAMLKDANAAMSDGEKAYRSPHFRLKRSWQARGRSTPSACTPANTMLITQVVEHVLRDPLHQKDPEIWAFCANVRCCDYLN